MAGWTIIGVPTSAGAHHAGQDRAPAALRKAGLVERLTGAGVSVDDSGDLPGGMFAVDREHPEARNLASASRTSTAMPILAPPSPARRRPTPPASWMPPASRTC
jgi:arginase family enzyme